MQNRKQPYWTISDLVDLELEAALRKLDELKSVLPVGTDEIDALREQIESRDMITTVLPCFIDGLNCGERVIERIKHHPSQENQLVRSCVFSLLHSFFSEALPVFLYLGS